MDLLAEVLAVSGVRATLGARIEAADSWGVRWAGTADAAFYAVTAGFAWLGIGGRAARQLMPGDVVLLPKGTGHTLSSQPNAAIHACDLAAAEKARGNGDVLRFGAGTVQTRIVGAAYSHDPAVSTQVLGLLPEVVHLRSENGGDCLDDTVRLLGRELAHPQMASAIVLNSLIDILLVQLLRTWLAANPDRPDQSWLGVLGDPLMTEALTKLHKQPDRAWTTETLAAQMSVSRSTLSRRFTAVLGLSPGAYLTQWRMDLAARQLRDTDASIAAVARSVGYTSQYAFSRAFTRARAQSPGRYRVTARSA